MKIEVTISGKVKLVQRNLRKVKITGGINVHLKVKWSWCNPPLVFDRSCLFMSVFGRIDSASVLFLHSGVSCLISMAVTVIHSLHEYYYSVISLTSF